MKQLICFDLDNTLIKSDRAHVEAFVLAFNNHGLKVERRRIFPLLCGLPSSVIVNKLFPRLSDVKIKRIVKEHDYLVANQTYKLVRLMRGSLKVLKILKKDYEIAVLSNCNHTEIKPLMKGAGISNDMYDLIVGKDQVRRSKPYPDELFKAEKLLKHKAVCMIGDSIFDVMAGKMAGVKTISVLTGHNTRNELKEKGADVIVKDITKVPSALNKILIKEL
jgi:HAD superfamily hydrolase (TIGR01549 family)